MANALKNLSLQQQITYSAMTMDPKNIPDFNLPEHNDAHKTGEIIKKMVDDHIITKLCLNVDGSVNVRYSKSVKNVNECSLTN